jgi:hypothetical protein
VEQTDDGPRRAGRHGSSFAGAGTGSYEDELKSGPKSKILVVQELADITPFTYMSILFSDNELLNTILSEI